MRFIESSVLGVRSSVITLRRPGVPMQFVLFPMVHIAEPAFYAAVADRLRGCGLIVAEGYPRPQLRRLRKLAVHRLDDLVDQVVALDLESLGLPILWPEHRISDEPPTNWDRLAESAGAVATWLSRMNFPERLPDVDDTPQRDEPAKGLARVWDRLTPQDRLRDRALVAALAKVFRLHQREPLMTAVVYGAQHMAAAAGFLTEYLGYQACHAEWLTVRTVGD